MLRWSERYVERRSVSSFARAAFHPKWKMEKKSKSKVKNQKSKFCQMSKVYLIRKIHWKEDGVQFRSSCFHPKWTQIAFQKKRVSKVKSQKSISVKCQKFIWAFLSKSAQIMISWKWHFRSPEVNFKYTFNTNTHLRNRCRPLKSGF